MNDSTFTISNLGGHGVDDVVPLIHEPNAAILGVGALQSRAVARDGVVVLAPALKLTLVSDHRVLDGAMAARLLGAIRSGLEQVDD
jgi:pyruvate/2-oxoglutarate dehydrogenase complex dihydrolipoamide acyltransferase (E2) component